MQESNNLIHSGILRKKKLKHGMFEDPYKTKVKGWIRKATLFIQPVQSKGSPIASIAEEFDMLIWQVGQLICGPFNLRTRGSPCTLGLFSFNFWSTRLPLQTFS
jgi:hypothetical protein